MMTESDEPKVFKKGIKACLSDLLPAECETQPLPEGYVRPCNAVVIGQPGLWKEAAEMFEQISVREGAMNDEPCIADTRIPVSIIVSMVGEGYTCEEVAEDYGTITVEQVQEAVLFAARLTWYI